jgi:LysM repeat protein
MREFGNALVAALLSIGLTLGALSISLVGFIPEEPQPATETSIPSPIPVTATNTFPPTSTPLPGADTPTPSATNTLAQSTSCPPPPGWRVHFVQAGETLDRIASLYGVTKDYLKSKNCLVSDNLIPGTQLNVPNFPTNTFAACVPGLANWSKSYVVRPNETFFSIAYRHYISPDELKRVNCRNTDFLAAGETIWVPNVTPRAFSATPAGTSISTLNITATPVFTEPGTMLPFTLTASSTPTFAPTATVTPQPTPTATLTPFPTATNTP